MSAPDRGRIRLPQVSDALKIRLPRPAEARGLAAQFRTSVRSSEVLLVIVAAMVGVGAGALVTAMSGIAQLAHVFFFGIALDQRLSAVDRVTPLAALTVPVLGGVTIGLIELWRRHREARVAVDPVEANALRGGRRPAGQDRAQDLGAEPLDRERHDVQTGQRPSPHRVDVAEGVGRGDPAEVVRVVDDGREKVDRLDQGQIVAEAVDPGVVAGGVADQNVGVRDGWQAAQDLRQVGGADFTRSTRAGRIGGQADAAPGGLHGRRIQHRRANARRSRPCRRTCCSSRVP